MRVCNRDYGYLGFRLLLPVAFLLALSAACVNSAAASKARGRPAAARIAASQASDTSAGAAPPEFFPDDGQPQRMPDSLPYAGWHRYLGTGDFAHVLGSWRDSLLVSMGMQVYSYVLSTGAELWHTDVGSDFIMGEDVLLGPETLYVDYHQGCRALDLATGHELWAESGQEYGKWQPVAVSSQGVWVTAYETTGGVGNWYYHDLALLDRDSGEILQQFHPDPYTSELHPSGAPTDWLPVKQGDVIRFYGADGSTFDLDSPRPRWAARFIPLAAGMLIAETPDPDIYLFSDDYEAAWSAEVADPRTGAPGPCVILRRLALPEREISWTTALDDHSIDVIYSGLSYSDNYLALATETGVQVLSLADGRTIWDGGEQLTEQPWSQIELLGSRLYIEAGDELGSALLAVDLPSGKSYSADNQQLTLPDGGNADWLAYVLDYGWGGAYGGNISLQAVRLDAAGLPQAGTPAILSPPFDYADLAARFTSARDPLQDRQLADTVRDGGVNVMARLLRATAPEQEAHLNLLADVVAEAIDRPGRDTGRQKMPGVFVAELRALAAPAYAPFIARLLKDDRFDSLNSELLGVLAQCGGELAATEAAEHYGDTFSQQLEPPAPPYKVLSEGWIDPEYIDEWIKNAGFWAEADTESGGRYVALLGTGLLTDRDIFLGLDADGDELFEQLLPTGLQDMFYSHTHPGGPYGPQPLGALKLDYQAGEFTIQHHQPLYEAADEYGYRRLNMDQTRRLATALSLDELQRDSDGDGLTDIYESMLFTDPNSADTDGDGLADAKDSCPLADPARMGQVERGVARALALMFSDGYDREWWQADQTQLPLQARYVLVHGCGPIAFSGHPGTYSICLTETAQRRVYGEKLNGYPGMHDITVRWLHRDMSPEEMFSAYYYGEVDDVENYAQEMKTWSEYGYQQLGDADCVVTVDYWLSGYRIDMVEIEGEYYPINCNMTWIS